MHVVPSLAPRPLPTLGGAWGRGYQFHDYAILGRGPFPNHISGKTRTNPGNWRHCKPSTRKNTTKRELSLIGKLSFAAKEIIICYRPAALLAMLVIVPLSLAFLLSENHSGNGLCTICGNYAEGSIPVPPHTW